MVSRAIGKYLVRLDADDLLTPIFCQVAEKFCIQDTVSTIPIQRDRSKNHVLSQMRPKFCMDEIVSEVILLLDNIRR